MFCLPEFKDEGALLICGKRGVGKTSVIFSAIHEAKRLEEEKILQEKERLKNEYRSDDASKLEEKAVKILPILVNAPGFELSKDHKENDKPNDSNEGKSNNKQPEFVDEFVDFRRAVLQNVVRRLYQVTRSIDKNGKVLKQESNQAGINTTNNSLNGKTSTLKDLVSTQSDSNKSSVISNVVIPSSKSFV